MRRRKQTVAIALGVAVVLALGAWVAGGTVQSPAQIAAETAAPDASAITVPVERRVLSSEVIVRGTVRYGSPQPVVLANSELKQGSSGNSGSIVTTRPRRGSRFGEGTDVMSVSGRPVFVLRGAQASHRDMGPGSHGPDVEQLESALRRMGFNPGSVDGRYDGATAAAVADWYEGAGWQPFGPTDAQLDQLRAARAAAAAARDAYVQSRVAIRTAAEGTATPTEKTQARIDLQTARDAVTTATHELETARIRYRSASDTARGTTAVRLALANERRDNALATAEVALKRAAVSKALDAAGDARRNLDDLPPDTSPAERASLLNALRSATDDIGVAQADLNASLASATATRAAGRDGVAKARADARQFDRDAKTAKADLVKAQVGLPAAQRQVRLAEQRLRVLSTPGDTTLQRQLADSARREARGTAQDVSRLARKVGIYVPADEVLFFPTLPLRVDSVRARRGDAVNGRVMTVSNSRLAVDSSLSVNDAKLVRAGAPVTIEEPDLRVKTTGVVTQVADRPGTHKVDPSRIYLEVAPKSAPAQLVGASVKLTIAVKSTEEAVLVVPVTALSVGADGSARVQVRRAGGQTEYVTVSPGLAAKGLVEVRPVRGQLAPGDLVIVGERGGPGGGIAPSDSSTPPTEGTITQPPKKEPPNATPNTSPPAGEKSGETTTEPSTGENTPKESTTPETTPPSGEQTAPSDGSARGSTP